MKIAFGVRKFDFNVREDKNQRLRTIDKQERDHLYVVTETPFNDRIVSLNHWETPRSSENVLSAKPKLWHRWLGQFNESVIT